jgi:hypothetical protein
MSEPLEELRAQRDLIQKHLDWLDQQIAIAESSAEQTTTPINQPPVAKNAVEPTVKMPAVVSPQEPASINPEFEIDEERHLASNTSDVKRAQIGCFLIFVAGTLLFLFLLFGLPYLSD